MDVSVKQELVETQKVAEPNPRRVREDSFRRADSVIELSSSSCTSGSGSDSDSDGDPGGVANGTVSSNSDGVGSHSGVVLPVGFLKPLRKEMPLPLPQPEAVSKLDATRKVNDGADSSLKVIGKSFKQFWKAGDYVGHPSTSCTASSDGMDHVRVHPKFLHSNATSHKWALGAFAELLDNALDEVCNDATHVNVDMLLSKKDNSRMLLIEDNGGGMDPDKIRQCISLGYSVKSKMANLIGQYGNGFKTSTMRLGADVIVFSRCQRKDDSPTESIGLLSYTFLRSTGKEDIVVPMLDYERKGQEWNKLIRSSTGDWNTNVETIVQWSPFSSEADLLRQFDLMKDQGTRIIIYNLWEDDQGQLELDFDADPHDIQIKGVNREEKNIQMAKEFPNSRHFLTYRHSLRSYVSILYLRIPRYFRIILRGKDVDHHNIVNDMMLSQEITYRPQFGADAVQKDSDMVATVTIGFVKDAKYHIDVSGFNVYHKNRLIKPFWRLWNPTGSGGRGVIGVLEADFVEPAHDKQSFERTTVLSRLETRLIQMQKSYWGLNCHKIGYVSNRSSKIIDASTDEDFSPSKATGKGTPSVPDKLYSHSNLNQKVKYEKIVSDKSKRRRKESSPEPSLLSDSDSDDVHVVSPKRQSNGTVKITQRQSNGKTNHISSPEKYSGRSGTVKTRSCMYSDYTDTSGGNTVPATSRSHLQANTINGHGLSESDLQTLEWLKEENQKFKERLQMKETDLLGELLKDLQHQKDKYQSLEAELKAAQQKVKDLNQEQENLIDIFSEERDRRDAEERNLRKKLQEASSTIQELLDKVKLLERTKSCSANQG